MKIKQIHEELKNLANELGIKIRKENGSFKSGWCVINDNKLIIVNRNTPMETISAVIARCLAKHDIDNLFIKPAVRDYIDNEKQNIENVNEFSLEIDY
jgi:hypothetical protein